METRSRDAVRNGFKVETRTALNSEHAQWTRNLSSKPSGLKQGLKPQRQGQGQGLRLCP